MRIYSTCDIPHSFLKRTLWSAHAYCLRETNMDKRKIFVMLLALPLVASCGDNGGGNNAGHEHTYRDDYTYDMANHWRETTCGHDASIDYGPHTFVENVIAPTYETVGYTVHRCSVCGFSYDSDYVDPLQHRYNNDAWAYNEEGHYHPCVDEGYESLVTNLVGHSYGQYTVTVEPTQNEKGEETASCLVCDYEHSREIPSYAEQSANSLTFALNQQQDAYVVSGFDFTVEHLVIPAEHEGKPVVSIGSGAFRYNWQIGQQENYRPLRSVALPTSVTEIASYAFYDDSYLEEINLQNILTIGEYAFYSCDKLNRAILTVAQEIGNFAFQGAVNLFQVYLENPECNFGSSVFYGCDKLVEVRLPSEWASDPSSHVGSSGLLSHVFYTIFDPIQQPSRVHFQDDGVIYYEYPSMVGHPDAESWLLGHFGTSKKLDFAAGHVIDGALNGDPFLEEIDISAYEDIGDNAFYHLTSLKKATISSPTIGDFVLNWNPVLEEATVNGATSIGASFAADCSLLEKIVLPGQLESLGDGFASGDSALATIECASTGYIRVVDNVLYTENGKRMVFFPSAKSMEGFVFSTLCEDIGSSVFKNRVMPQGFDLPDQIRYVGNEAFYGAEHVLDGGLPANLEYIGEDAFAGVEIHGDLAIPDSVRYIAAYAFEYNSGIDALTLGASIEWIGEMAFRFCSISTIYWNINLPGRLPSMSSDALTDARESGCKFVVGEGVDVGGLFPNYLFEFVDGEDNEINRGGTRYSEDGLVFSHYDYYATEEVFTIAEGTEYIDNNAFSSNDYLKKIIIPNSVHTIGASAFAGMNALEEIVMSSNVTSYPNQMCQNCTSLVKVNTPSKLSSMGYGCFSGCDSFVPDFDRRDFHDYSNYTNPEYTETTYENGVYRSYNGNPYQIFMGMITTSETSLTIHPDCTELYLGTSTFPSSLQSIDFPENIERIELASASLYGIFPSFCFTEEGGAKYVGDSDNPHLMLYSNSSSDLTVHSDCKYIIRGGMPSSLTLNSGLLGIYEGAFYSSTIETLTIPSSVKRIEREAFNDCTSLQHVYFGGTNLFYIGGNAFGGANLTGNLVIPNSVRILGGYLFDSAETVTISSPSISSDSNSYPLSGVTNLVFTTAVEEIGSYMCHEETTNITIGSAGNSNLRSIGKYAFRNNDMTSINLSSVKVIGEGAFMGASLEHVTFGNELRVIGKNAFENCSSLASVNFPASLFSIGNEAFKGSGLTSVTVNEGCYALGEATFGSCENLIEAHLPATLNGIYNITAYSRDGLSSGWIIDAYFPFEGSNALTTIEFQSFAFQNMGYESIVDRVAVDPTLTGLETVIVPTATYAFIANSDYYSTRIHGVTFQCLNGSVSF